MNATSCTLVSLLLGALYSASVAHAYCRETTCDPTSGRCALDEHQCLLDGAALHWSDGSLELAVDSQSSLLAGFSQEQLKHAASEALATWTNAPCPDGGRPSLHLGVSVRSGVALGFDPAGPNENFVGMLDETWPYEPNVVGKTTLVFDEHSGELYDADVVLNTHNYPLSLDTDGVDLVAVLIHELGHVLGLDHSDVVGATMQPEARGFGTSELRTLERDDIEGICAIYPPPTETATGDPAADAAAPATTRSGCSVLERRAGPARAALQLTWLVALLCGTRLLRRVRKQRKCVDCVASCRHCQTRVTWRRHFATCSDMQLITAWRITRMLGVCGALGACSSSGRLSDVAADGGFFSEAMERRVALEGIDQGAKLSELDSQTLKDVCSAMDEVIGLVANVRKSCAAEAFLYAMDEDECALYRADCNANGETMLGLEERSSCAVGTARAPHCELTVSELLTCGEQLGKAWSARKCTTQALALSFPDCADDWAQRCPSLYGSDEVDAGI